MRIINQIQNHNFLNLRRFKWDSEWRKIFTLGILFLTKIVLITGCTFGAEQSDKTLFEKVSPETSKIDFTNNLSFDNTFNVFTYAQFYAGGGVALGDINNDGLLDIYLVANQKSNRLYLNKGNFEFEDITELAGVGGTRPWSTGVSMVDINGNDLLDIYVTNSAAPNGEDRKNELFINNGDLTFTEQAEAFGIADSGYSIHASFFDYDNDGYLDMFLINNHNSKSIGSYDLNLNLRNVRSYNGGDRLYRNDGEKFTDVTEKAGIYSSEIGIALGVSVADLNRDGWLDIYISNDFFERDYLYMNQGDGTFLEMLESKFSSISTTSMGSDIADLDNDSFPEIFVTDMLPENEERLKSITAFIDWEQYMAEVEMGYHHKFTRNTLQYNNKDGTFSEIGRYAGVEATDWSWGALLADFNLDGRRDIFVANGIYKDETDKDFLIASSKNEVMKDIIVNNAVNYQKLLELMPSTPTSNYMFENQGNLQFINRAAEWGLDELSFSNGSAYGDLNNNGSLDLVVNNVNMDAFIYRNRANELYPDRNWLQIILNGQHPNTNGVGAKVELIAEDYLWYAEQIIQRGFQSSVDPTLHIGLGSEISIIDTLKVYWPDGRLSLKTNVEVGQRVIIQQNEAQAEDRTKNLAVTNINVNRENLVLTDITQEMELNWEHQESSYNDFIKSPLSFHMRSTEGPPICSGDINGNGLDDFYVGGSSGQPGALFLQTNDGKFAQIGQPNLDKDRESEDTDCIFFDANGDGRPELYVASGSSEFNANSELLADRLYRIDNEGVLFKLEDSLPIPQDGYKATGVVRAADFDGDGSIDLFIGVRMSLLAYGIPVGGYLLKNDGTGRFIDVTDQWAPQLKADQLKSAGITVAQWGDLNGNGDLDLMIGGEWMPLTVFYNIGGRLERVSHEITGLVNTTGWWQSLVLADLNGNGRLDFVGGNHGLNSRFRATSEWTLQMWSGDFNKNGIFDQVFGTYNSGKGPYTVSLLHDLLYHLPSLRTKYSKYADFAGQKINDVFTQTELNNAFHYQAEQLASIVGWNNGDGSFSIDSLPFRAQWSPIYAILPYDMTGDGILELMIGGNLQAVQPQAGPYDASFGLMLEMDINGKYKEMPAKESGISISGDIRSIKLIKGDGKTFVVVSRSNKPLKIYKLNSTEI